MLPFPYSSGVNGSRHSAMRELRVQHRGRPYRVLYIFDPRRVALLLLGGDKTGDDRWYEKNVPLAVAASRKGVSRTTRPRFIKRTSTAS